MGQAIKRAAGQMRRAGLFVALIAAAAVIGVAASMLATRARVSKADPDNAAQVAEGARVYEQYCASCHGVHLEGQPNWRQRKPDGRNPAPPHDYHGHTWMHPDDDLFGMVKSGFAAYAPPGYKTDMIAFGNVLSDEQIWAVLAFIKSSWPVEFRKFQASITAGANTRMMDPLHHSFRPKNAN